MKLYLVKTPKILEKLYSRCLWRFSTSKKEIYLTFDDGPTPKVTQFVLEQLQKHNAKATFFCIGKNVVNHPEILQQIINDGHSIGNHTHNHLNGWKNHNKKYLENISDASKVIPSKLFRPPYGKIKFSQTKQLKKLGYTIVMWDVLSADFDTSITNKQCLQNVLDNTEKGSIVVFHDSIKAEEKLRYTLPKTLKYFGDLGYSFKAL